MVVSNLFGLFSDLDLDFLPVFARLSVNAVPDVVADNVLFPIGPIDHLEWFVHILEKYVV